MAVKIEQEKAYDRIEQDFLDEVLHKVGFDSHLEKLIMQCTSHGTLSVLQNGAQLGSFTPSKGIR